MTVGGSGQGQVDVTGAATLSGVVVTDSNTSDGIDVTASGAVLTLTGGTAIDGAGTGTMTVGGSGQGQVDVTGAATLSGVVVTDSNTSDGIDVTASGAILTLDGGTTINGGTGPTPGNLTVESGGKLAVTGSATLDGVIVDDDATTTPAGIDVAATLTLNGGTQIQGGGSGTLTVESAGGLSITGSGATLDGVLVTDSNSSDGIDVVATLTLNDGTQISGGTLTVESTGELQITKGSGADGAPPSGATLDGVTVTDDNTSDGIDVASGAILTLDGGTTINTGVLTIGSTGTVDVESTGSIGPDATLNGVTVNDNNSTTDGIEVGQSSTATLLLEGGTTINGGPLMIGSTGTVDVESTGSIGPDATLNGQVVNKGTIEATDGGYLLIQGSLDNEGGTISIEDGTVELGVTNRLTVNFSDSGGTLQLDGTVTGGSAAGVDATSTGTAAMTITGAGSVTSTGADGIDATSAGGDITITPAGAVTGAFNGIDATQNGSGSITISTTGTVLGNNGPGIIADESATAVGGILIDGTGAVTGTDSDNSGILAEILNAANASDVTVSQTGNISGAFDGVLALTDGDGNVTVTTGASATITGTAYYGILALSYGSGSVSVSTTIDDTVDSGSAGIVAENWATPSEPSSLGSITVTAYGAINSGTQPTLLGNAPAGILAGYLPGGAASPNTNVSGSVIVNDDANITAQAGDGIRAFNFGNGDVTVNDNYGAGAVTSTTISGGLSGVVQYGILAEAESGGTGDVAVNIGANATISTSTGPTGLYGIGAFTDGVGNITVLMTSATDSITSGSDGIAAVSTTAPTASTSSAITVTADGIITSGSNLDADGNTPGGIVAGYFPDNNGTLDSDAAGSVTITSDATINAAGGYGIDAFTFGSGGASVTTDAGSSITVVSSIENTAIGIAAYALDGGDASISNAGTVTASTGIALFAEAAGGSGDVTVNDLSGTTISGEEYGIAAYAEGSGNGNVTVNVSQNASITATGEYGIRALNDGTGNVSVSTSTGDVITSGSSGINAVNEATTLAAVDGSTITVTAYGTIDSASTLNVSGGEPAGITAGYFSDGGNADLSVTGTVIVNNFANITATGGYGINAYDWGNGDVTVNDNYGPGALVAGNTVSGVQDGILARALSGGTGDVTVNVGPDASLSASNALSFGIYAFSVDTGNITVLMSTGDVITSGSDGVVAVNEASAIASSADSSITVTAAGTIDSGSNPDGNGNPPAGILASYYPNNSPTPESSVFGNVSVTSDATIDATAGSGIVATNFGTGSVTVTTEAGSSITAPSYGILAAAYVDGTVTVDNFANITTAPTGAGIDAENYGNGDVTVDDNFGEGAAASNSVSGGQYGIEAEALGGGSGDVAVNVGTNASISTSNASTALFGIFALSLNTGNVAVSTLPGDDITSASAGIVAVNEASMILPAADSTITVTAAGLINSGSNLQDDALYPPAGIIAGYFPNNAATASSSVAGDVSVTSDASITAAAGYGIWAFNFGTGDVAVTTDADSSIVTNGSSITTSAGTFAPVGIGAYAFDGGDASITNAATVTAANGIALLAQATGGDGTGTVTINNQGSVSGAGTTASPVVEIVTGGGAAILTNSGTIDPSASLDLAISETGGSLTINNTGTIIGNVALATTMFNNESGGVWDVSGSNTFGSGSTIDNAGQISGTGTIGSGSNNLTLANDAGGTIDATGGTLTLDAGGEGAADGQNLVVNGGFERGNLTGWTEGGDLTQSVYDQVTTIDPHSGSYDLEIGAIGDNFDVSQNITTDPGATYQVEFWLANPGGTPSDFTASFGSTTLLSLNNSAAQGYTEYIADVTATSSSSELLFVARQDPSFWYLDDISVVQITSPITNAGLMKATNGTLDLQNSIDNTGTSSTGTGILVDGTSILKVDTLDLQLTGGGTVTLDSGSQIVGGGTSSTPDRLENVNNTITGTGKIGDVSGDLALTNDTGGTIDANVSGQTLTLDTGHTITNEGLLEATSGGTLQIVDPVNNTDGTIEVNSSSTSSTVDIASSVSGGNVTFLNGSGTYGELVLTDPLHFTADVTGFAGTSSSASDEILVNVPESDVSISEPSGPHSNATVTIQDGTSNTITIVDPQGDVYKESDGPSDTIIYDPPATHDHHDDRSTDWHTAQGQDQFNFAPDGQYASHDLAGSVSLDGPSNDNFNFHSPDGQNAPHDQAGSVSLGGPGNDNFTFHPPDGQTSFGQPSSHNIDFHPNLGVGNAEADLADSSQGSSVQFQHTSSLTANDVQGDPTHIIQPDDVLNTHYVALQSVVHLH
jgi:hypothetical protein